MLLETNDFENVRESWAETHRRTIGVAILSAVAGGIVAILAMASMVG